MLTKLFLTVLNMSLTGGLTVVVVLLVRLALKRAPKVFSYALWAVVLLRLLCPVMISSPLSLWNLARTPVLDYSVQAPVVVTPPVTTPPPAPVAGTVTPAPVTIPPAADGVRETAMVIPAATAKPMQVLARVWLAGVGVMLAYSLWQLLRLRRKLVGAVLLEPGVYLADGIDTPFVMGLLRPKIYLPFALGAREREYILLHERHHIRRGDHAVKLLAFLALCLHWFNPLVWLAFVLAGQDMEMRCDEAVLRALGEEVRADYSATLLSLATGRRIIAGAPLAFGEGDPKRRIKNVLNYKKPAFWLVLVAVAACLAAAVCLLTDPVKQQDNKTPEVTPPPDQLQYAVSDGPMYWFDEAERGPKVTAFYSPHWPDRLFRDTETNERIYALETDGTERTVIEGLPIRNAWLLDLTGDGAPEVCATVDHFDAGARSTHIEVYDYVNDATYTLWDRGVYDYALREKDGILLVVQRNYADGNVQAAARPLRTLEDLTPAQKGTAEPAIPADSGGDAVMLAWDGNGYVQTALAMSAARTWTKDGWVYADGLPLEALLKANAGSMPTVTWSDQLKLHFGDGATPMQLSVFREDFTRVEDFVLVDQPGSGEGFGQLAPGTYYVVNRVSVHGQHIEAAGDSEYTIYWCMFRLIIE